MANPGSLFLKRTWLRSRRHLKSTLLSMGAIVPGECHGDTRQSPVIVALDFDTQRQAMELVRQLGADARSYKVGLQLLTQEGPSIVRALVAMGKEVFLDLKLHEIPNSIAGAISAAGKLGASMVSVHASGGSAVLKAAVAATAPYPNLKVLALTVITSLSDNDLPEIGLAPSVEQQADRLAQLAARCGCHGVIASAHEAARLASILPAGMYIVTPGIQLGGAAGNDQARVATSAMARESGATHVVIGRSITKASSPREAFAEALSGFGHSGHQGP
jgi:orotidine-5'-phosphate decarboxylase